jgi:hypothetical protein
MRGIVLQLTNRFYRIRLRQCALDLILSVHTAR